VCPHRDSDVQPFVRYTSTSVLALPAGAVSPPPSGGEANLVSVTGSATFIRRPGAADDLGGLFSSLANRLNSPTF
jgi:hypothetical protein